MPAVDYALEHKGPVVVSTNTISLQEQLIGKDIPLLQASFPKPFTAVLAKGRANYVCLRRLALAGRGQGDFFDDAEQLRELERISAGLCGSPTARAAISSASPTRPSGAWSRAGRLLPGQKLRVPGQAMLSEPRAQAHVRRRPPRGEPFAPVLGPRAARCRRELPAGLQNARAGRGRRWNRWPPSTSDCT